MVIIREAHIPLMNPLKQTLIPDFTDSI